ncbi:NUDIX hydrolase [Yasminevirus sp. GU-2018]|uniref:NUDIX hydrolase n=1 Tax=Yasminevirus sp. GU-2018 TaxID=2420051 RepID=A0A5K0UAD6_9VIRU|nr:NUDIX hydrolase [Yasminevirus sp. GU-2018]
MSFAVKAFGKNTSSVSQWNAGHAGYVGISKSVNAPTCAGFVVVCVNPTHGLTDTDSDSSRKHSRKHSRGVVTATSNEPHVLLVSTHKNVWGFPKGKRNSGELYDICAFRELKEETGLTHNDINPVDMEMFCLHEVTDKGTPSVKLYLATTDRLVTPIVEDVDELGCAKWMPVSEAYNLLTLKNRKQILRDALSHLKIDIDTYLKEDATEGDSITKVSETVSESENQSHE